MAGPSNLQAANERPSPLLSHIAAALRRCSLPQTWAPPTSPTRCATTTPRCWRATCEVGAWSGGAGRPCGAGGGRRCMHICLVCSATGPPPLLNDTLPSHCTGNPVVAGGADELAEIGRLLMVRPGRACQRDGAPACQCAEQFVPPAAHSRPSNSRHNLQRNKAQQGARTPPATSPQATRALVRAGLDGRAAVHGCCRESGASLDVLLVMAGRSHACASINSLPPLHAHLFKRRCAFRRCPTTRPPAPCASRWAMLRWSAGGCCSKAKGCARAVVSWNPLRAVARGCRGPATSISAWCLWPADCRLPPAVHAWHP